MSLSKPVERTVNPAKKFIKWEGDPDKGYFSYYDKEKNQNFELKDFKFMVLDQDLFSIKGYDKPEKTTYISNEVRTNHDLIIINAYKDKKRTEFKRGTYEHLKDAIKGNNSLNFTKSLYVMTPDGELVHIDLKGSALGSWFNDITSSNLISSNWIYVKEVKEGKNGIVKYAYPVFGFGEKVSEADYKKAFKIDSEVLQPYLEAYLLKNGSSTTKGEAPQPHDEGSYSQEVPEFDTSEWRKFLHPISKKALCHYHKGELIDIKIGLEQDGDTENNPFYDCVGHAVYEYQQGEKTWQDKALRDGRKLKDVDLEELKSLLTRMDAQAPEHEAKISIENAIEAKTPSPMIGEDDAEIPF